MSNYVQRLDCRVGVGVGSREKVAYQGRKTHHVSAGRSGTLATIVKRFLDGEEAARSSSADGLGREGMSSKY